MGLQATFVLYLVIGVGVEAALLTGHEGPALSRWFGVLSGILFWPLYVPILLGPPADGPLSDDRILLTSDELDDDELKRAITLAEAELNEALSKLDGRVRQELSSQTERLIEIQQAWQLQAAQIRELSELLSHATSTDRLTGDSEQTDARGSADVCESTQVRRANLRRLSESEPPTEPVV